MILYVIIGMFGAFGVLCALWILLGCHLTDPVGGTVIVHLAPEQVEAMVRRFAWLRNMGLVRRKPVVVLPVSSQVQQCLAAQHPDVEFLTWEQYLLWLEQERKNLDGN